MPSASKILILVYSSSVGCSQKSTNLHFHSFAFLPALTECFRTQEIWKLTQSLRFTCSSWEIVFAVRKTRAITSTHSFWPYAAKIFEIFPSLMNSLGGTLQELQTKLCNKVWISKRSNQILTWFAYSQKIPDLTITKDDDKPDLKSTNSRKL